MRKVEFIFNRYINYDAAKQVNISGSDIEYIKSKMERQEYEDIFKNVTNDIDQILNDCLSRFQLLH